MPMVKGKEITTDLMMVRQMMRVRQTHWQMETAKRSQMETVKLMDSTTGLLTVTQMMRVRQTQ